MASVSRPARERRTLRRERSMRSIQGAHSLRDRSWYPPAISASATPRSLSSYSRAISRRSASTEEASGPSSTSTRTESPTGASLAKRRASRICLVVGAVTGMGSLLLGVDGLGVRGPLETIVRVGWRLAAPRDPDGTELVLLRDLDAPQLQHLEETQERGDLFQAAHERLQHLFEQEPCPLPEPRLEERDRLLQSDRLRDDGVDRRRRFAGEDVLQRVEQAEETHREQLARVGVLELRGSAPVKAKPSLPLQLLQRLRRLLEPAILEELSDQALARVLFLLHGRDGGGKKHARLDPHERRRHHEELPRHFQVQLPHQIQRLQILAGDLRDRDVGDLDLVLLDQVQQQVQRPFEGREVHPNGEPLALGRVRFLVVAHPILIASRTSRIVASATARARSSP